MLTSVGGGRTARRLHPFNCQFVSLAEWLICTTNPAVFKTTFAKSVSKRSESNTTFWLLPLIPLFFGFSKTENSLFKTSQDQRRKKMSVCGGGGGRRKKWRFERIEVWVATEEDNGNLREIEVWVANLSFFSNLTRYERKIGDCAYDSKHHNIHDVSPTLMHTAKVFCCCCCRCFSSAIHTCALVWGHVC